MKRVSLEVILELVLADLPVYLDDKACLNLKNGGDSWWFLACECNDRYLDVVEELISICSYQQVHTLCFMTQADSRSTLVACASPACKEFLTVSLLFVGRFEFLESAYKTQADAKNEKIRLINKHKKLLANRDFSIEKADLGTKGIFYRLKLVSFSSERIARKLCDNLRERKQDCLFIRN